MKLKAGTTTDITPQIELEKYPNYVFHVEILSHPRIVMTRAFHPNFYLPGNQVPDIRDLHQSFQNGTELLATDHDTKIPDDSPSLNTPTKLPPDDPMMKVKNPRDPLFPLRDFDDAPAYVEFVIRNAPYTRVAGTNLFGPFALAEYQKPKYFDITKGLDATNLMNQTGNGIKQVKQMHWKESNGKLARPIGLGRRLTNEFASIVFADPPTPFADVAIHEWMHTRGLWHRSPDRNDAGNFPNPGPGGQREIMAINNYNVPNTYVYSKYRGLHERINRRERTYIPSQ